MNIPVVILAGGLATRLRPLTEKYPKAMVEVEGKPFLEYQLDLLRRQGFTEIILCVGYKGEQIEEYFGDGQAFGVSLKYRYDGDTLLGTGGALKRVLDWIEDVFVVLYGDSYLDIDYRPVVEAFLKHYKVQQPQAPLGLMTVYHNKGQYDQSNVVFQNQKLINYDKKSQTSDMEYIDWGLGLLSKKAFDGFSMPQFDLAEVYQKLVASQQLVGYEVFQRFYEVGSHSGLDEMKKYFQRPESPLKNKHP